MGCQEFQFSLAVETLQLCYFENRTCLFVCGGNLHMFCMVHFNRVLARTGRLVVEAFHHHTLATPSQCWLLLTVSWSREARTFHSLFTDEKMKTQRGEPPHSAPCQLPGISSSSLATDKQWQDANKVTSTVRSHLGLAQAAGSEVRGEWWSLAWLQWENDRIN